jgi:uncharacterized peroxidase-related enzyme
MSTRIKAIQNNEATGKAKELLDAVQAKLGMTPNLMKTLAHSAAVLEGYLGLNQALSSTLSATQREQIAIAVANANGCRYCLSAHSAIGNSAGLSAEEISSAREARANDPKAQAVLKLASEIVTERGSISDEGLAAARTAGLTDAEITEVVGNVALNILTNYFNNVAQTEIDFPEVALAASA